MSILRKKTKTNGYLNLFQEYAIHLSFDFVFIGHNIVTHN